MIILCSKYVTQGSPNSFRINQEIQSNKQTFRNAVLSHYVTKIFNMTKEKEGEDIPSVLFSCYVMYLLEKQVQRSVNVTV